MQNRIITSLIATGLLSAAAMAVHADDLLKLVHQDAAVCLHVPRPVADWNRIQSSQFASRVVASPLFQEWQSSPEFKGLEGLRTVIEGVVQKPLPQAAEELFGRGFALAAYVAPGGEPDAVLLLEADNEESINDLMNRLRQFVDPQTEQQTHRDFVYDHWVGKDGNGFYFVRAGNVLALAENADPVRRVIDLHLDGETGNSLANRAELITARERRPEQQVAAVYIAPRAWDSHVTSDDETPQALKNAWQRCQWLTVRMRYDQAPAFDVEADYDNVAAPEWWTQWVDLAGEKRLPVERIPDNALVAMSGLLDSPGITKLAGRPRAENKELPKDVRQMRRVMKGLLLGLDPLNDVLPTLGPRWMAYVIPRQLSDSDALSKSFPADMLFAIELQELQQTVEQEADSKQALHNTLVAGLNVLAAVHNTRTNQQVATVRQKTVDEVTIRWAEPVALFRPAYAITDDGYLLIASSPELCEQFVRGGKQTASPVAELASQLQFFVASSVAARQLLTTHKEWFLWRASKDKVPEDEAARRLQQMDGFLQMLDRVWFSTALESDLIRVSAGVTVDSGAGD